MFGLLHETFDLPVKIIVLTKKAIEFSVRFCAKYSCIFREECGGGKEWVTG